MCTGGRKKQSKLPEMMSVKGEWRAVEGTGTRREATLFTSLVVKPSM